MNTRLSGRHFVRGIILISVITAFIFFHSFAFKPAAEASSNGSQLYQSLGCVGCHAINGVGGKIGPDLSKVGSRLNAERILGQLNNPKSYNPASMMPGYQTLSGDQKKVLVEYLQSLK
jgi:cbb3-type cytochrome oxidase cytochrome c subunit